MSYVESSDQSPRVGVEAVDSIVEAKDKTKASLGEFFAARGANKSDFKTKLVEKNIIGTWIYIILLIVELYLDAFFVL